MGEAASALVKNYVEMRGLGGNRKVISATPRQLESLIRLSEAHARMRLSPSVEEGDVDAAMQSAAMDPKTGTIDMEIITTGRSASAREAARKMADQLKELLRGRSSETISLSDLAVEHANNYDVEVEEGELRDALGQLERDAVVRVVRNVVTVV